MPTSSFTNRRQNEQLSRREISNVQQQKLVAMLSNILPANAFYAEKLRPFDTTQLSKLVAPETWQAIPFTTKDELAATLPTTGLPANLTYPIADYVRFHRTSGTRGTPMPVLDTKQDWEWWLEAWQYVFDAAEVTTADRVLMAFSFGPFIGFWSAHDAAVSRGLMVIPSGGMTTLARLDLIRSANVTMIFGTPSYALHMAEVAAQNNIDLHQLGVRKIVVSGEPGGSLPATRQRIADLWNARIIDHAGASEIGPWGYPDSQDRGLRIAETEFLVEFVVPGQAEPAKPHEPAELILTSLGRWGSPVIRYRTGDIVHPVYTPQEPNHFVLLQGGIVGRADDMIVIRGVNIFPSSIGEIISGFPSVAEYRVTAERVQQMDRLVIEVEDSHNNPDAISQQLQLRLGLKIDVKTVAPNSLPRFEGKARRFIDRRQLT